jgi:hypothetical protein
MIKKAEKRKIKKVIGHRYGELIQAELQESQEFNKQGEMYTTGHITNVMNGEAHAVIEAAIYRAVVKQKKILQERAEILKA